MCPGELSELKAVVVFFEACDEPDEAYPRISSWGVSMRISLTDNVEHEGNKSMMRS